MNYIRFIFNNTQPLKISDSNKTMSYNTESLCYITGSAIRGLVMQQFVGLTDFDEYKTILLSKDVSFLPAYPSINGEPLLPSIKGFYEEKSQNGNLTNSFICKDEDFKGVKRADLGQFCMVDGDTIKYISIEKVEIINIQTKKKDSGEKLVFRSEAIKSGYEFTAVICVKDDSVADKIVEVLNSKQTYRIGGDKTAGYGQISVKSVEKISAVKYANFASNTNSLSEVYMIAVSPLAMRTDIGEIGGFNKEKIAQLLGVDSIEIIKSATSIGKTSGFNRTWNCGTPEYTYYEAGSVFKLQLSDTVSAEKLRKIEESGIGMGKNEGFGRVVFSSDIENITKKEKIDDICNVSYVEEYNSRFDVLSKDEEEAMLEIAAVGMLDAAIESQMVKYINDHEFKTTSASNSQVGIFMAICKNLRYNPADAISRISRHIEHIYEKEDKSKIQHKSGSQKVLLSSIEEIIDSKDILSLLGIDNEAVCCGKTYKEWMNKDEEKEVKLKLLLIESLITYGKRKGEK